MTKIQGNRCLVRVSARLELARVRVTGNRLYHKFRQGDKVRNSDVFFLLFLTPK